MTPRCNTCFRSGLVAVLSVLWIAAPVLGETGPPSLGAPLSLDDLLLLLRMKAPIARIQQVIERRGVDFAATNDVISRIHADGGDTALAGLLSLHQRTGAAPQPAGPPAEYLQNPAVRGLIASIPATASAADRGSCDIELRVDQSADVTLRDHYVLYDVVSGERPSAMTATCTGPLPLEERSVNIEKLRGRGQVTVLQRPAPRNGFLCRLRIEDTAEGSDTYRVRIDWHRP